MKVKLLNIISVILVLSMLMMVFPFNVMASSAYMDSNSGVSESGTGINAEAMQLYGSVTGIDKNDVQNDNDNDNDVINFCKANRNDKIYKHNDPEQCNEHRL